MGAGVAWGVGDKLEQDMTGVWIAVSAGFVLAVSLLKGLLRGWRSRADPAAKARIVDLADSTSLDRDTGAVRSVQKADLLIEEAAVRAIWTPMRPGAPCPHLLALSDARHPRADPRPLWR